MNNEIFFSFVERLTSDEKMDVSKDGNVTVVVPKQCPLSYNPAYQSPYQLRFHFDWIDLVAGFDQPPYCYWDQEGNSNYFPNAERWLDPAAYSNEEVGSQHWGPEPRRYPTLSLITEKSDQWKAERLLAVAASMIGYGYHHHHIPEWNPSEEWYRNLPEDSYPNFEQIEQARELGEYVGQGVDCSDYSSWLYNYALGIYLVTSVEKQGNMTKVLANDGTLYSVTRVADATIDYETLCSTLQIGDLLYIAGSPTLSKFAIQQDLQQNNPPLITHVIMWLGDVGFSKQGTPLITDSHGSEVLDENHHLVPNGIQVRPFYKATVPSTQTTDESSPSWYFDHFVWALRILPTL